MFDIGFFELLLIGIVGLLVLGPERLPRAARTAGLWVRRARATWYSVRSELERELAEADLKKSLEGEAKQLKELGQTIDNQGKSLAQAVTLNETSGSAEPSVDASADRNAMPTSDDVSAEDEKAMTQQIDEPGRVPTESVDPAAKLDAPEPSTEEPARQ